MTNPDLQRLSEQLGDLASELSVDLEWVADLPADLRDKLALALTRAVATLEPLGEELHEWARKNRGPAKPISRGTVYPSGRDVGED